MILYMALTVGLEPLLLNVRRPVNASKTNHLHIDVYLRMQNYAPELWLILYKSTTVGPSSVGLLVLARLTYLDIDAILRET